MTDYTDAYRAKAQKEAHIHARMRGYNVERINYADNAYTIYINPNKRRTLDDEQAVLAVNRMLSDYDLLEKDELTDSDVRFIRDTVNADLSKTVLPAMKALITDDFNAIFLLTKATAKVIWSEAYEPCDSSLVKHWHSELRWRAAEAERKAIREAMTERFGGQTDD